MFEFCEIPDTNILELSIDGKVTRGDFDKAVAKMETMIARHGKIKILEVVHNIGKMEPSAIWEDIKWSPKHLKDFSHAAVVADQKWIEWVTALVKPFVSVEIRFFHTDEIDNARRWLMEPE